MIQSPFIEAGWKLYVCTVGRFGHGMRLKSCFKIMEVQILFPDCSNYSVVQLFMTFETAHKI
jgi:hypothetical protein